MEQRIVHSTNDVTLTVHDFGGDGPDVLFAHATGFHGLVWEPVIRRLPQYRCLSIDFRAHGDSSAPRNRPLEWEGFADDVLAVCDEFNLNSPMAVGHSKGGASLLLAEIARPGTFKMMYLYEPVVMPPQMAIGYQSDNPLSNGARKRRSSFPSKQDAMENYAAKPPFSVLDADALAAYVNHGFIELAAPDENGNTVTLKCRPENEAEVYAHGSAHQAFLALGNVHCPVTIAIGNETYGPAAFGPGLVDALPHGFLRTYPDLAHFGPLENPEKIAAEISDAFVVMSA